MQFLNLTKNKIPQVFFEKILKVIFDFEKTKEKEIALVLVGKRRIRNLNKRFQGINKVTEVLHFSSKEVEKPTKKELQFMESKENLIGEIVLCPSYIKKQARRFKESFEQRMAKTFLHAMLHLLGFDHQDTQSTKKMRSREKEIFEKIKDLKYV